MAIRSVGKNLSLLFLILFTSVGLIGQDNGSIPYRSQEVSEVDGIPVLVKHLPAWELQKGNFTFATSLDELNAKLGNRPLLDRIEFIPGTEAVSAPYQAGTLVIIEFASPQGASAAGLAVTSRLADEPDQTIVYRRIGNYTALVFDVANRDAANALLDEVYYEKQIQWLGNNPFRISAERAFIMTTSDVFVSTVMFILMGVGFAIGSGLIAGTVSFRLRVRRRAAMTTHTDAGGMIRLNLDGLTPEIIPDNLLKD